MSLPIITPDLRNQMKQTLTPPLMPSIAMPSPAPSLPAVAAPSVSLAPHVPSQLESDQNELNRRVNTGSGIDQIHNPLLRGIARAGDIALSVFGAVSPVGAVLNATLPGTTMHHRVLVNQAERNLANDQASQKAADADLQSQATTAQTHALTDYTQQRPEIEQAKIQQKMDVANNKNAATLAPHGFVYSIGPDGTPEIAEDPTSQAYKDRVTLAAMHQATADKDNITAEIAQNHYMPGTPEYAEAQRKLAQVDQRMHIAMAGLGLRAQSLDLRRENTEAGLFGTVNGVAPAGAMIADDGRTVGTKFQQNVRPTGLERSKADMAASASTQIADMKAIAQKHPDFFGPGYGQASAFRQWIGSQDPDAQRFLAARTIAADHLAGTFGGRSEAALDALDKALGQFKDNPKAAIAGLDQLAGANEAFKKAGTVRTTGSNAGGSSSHAPAMIRAVDDKGVLHEAPAGTPLPKGWKAQ